MSQATIDRLQELLDQKDKRIEALEYKVEELQEQIEHKTRWTDHIIDTEADDGGLPVPRLEIVWQRLAEARDGYTMLARYDLVKHHLLGEIHRIPLGATRTTGEGVHRGNDGRIETPFRDGAHIAFDALELALPAYVIDGATGESDSIEAKDHTGARTARRQLLESRKAQP